MKKTIKYENKKVLVIGLAKSGKAAARLLHELNADVVINDRNPLEERIRSRDRRASIRAVRSRI